MRRCRRRWRCADDVSPLADAARRAALACLGVLSGGGRCARRADHRSHGAHVRRDPTDPRHRDPRWVRDLRPWRAAAVSQARTVAVRRCRRALLPELGARLHADARPVRADDQPADVARLLRAARDDGPDRLSRRAVDREGPPQAADRVRRRRREAGGADPRAGSAPPARDGEERGGVMVTAALHEGARPGNVFTRHDLHGDTVLDCDVVIVGSGAGGAPMAAELAEAEFDVVVLEEGSYYQSRDFTANTTQKNHQHNRDGGASMAIGNPPIMFQEGRAVGGSTVINGGMSWRTPEDILARWRDEAGLEDLTTAQLEPYYERVEKRIHVAPVDEDAIGNDNWLLKKGADAKGWKTLGNLRNHCL